MSDVFWMLAIGTFLVGLTAVLLPKLSLKPQQIPAQVREQRAERAEPDLAGQVH